MSEQTHTHTANPARFKPGRWSQEFNKHVGEGDIAASYSGDLIGRCDRVRPPFVFRGDLWVNVAQGGGVVNAYRLVPIDDAIGEPVCYADKAHAGAGIEHDPMGFYHGVVVRFKRDWFVLQGPPVRFVPGTVVQPGLFPGS